MSRGGDIGEWQSPVQRSGRGEKGAREKQKEGEERVRQSNRSKQSIIKQKRSESQNPAQSLWGSVGGGHDADGEKGVKGGNSTSTSSGASGRAATSSSKGGGTTYTTIEAEAELYTVLYTNARSVLNKLNELCVVAHEEKPDFILICESFCNSQLTDSLLKVPGYQLAVRQDGNNQGRARGLLLYCKEELKRVKLTLEILDKFKEGTGISVPWLGGRLSLVLVYSPPRHPGSPEDNGNTEKLAELIRGLQGTVLMCGDLNFPDIC